MIHFPLLTSSILCPLIGALFILFFVRNDEKLTKIIGLISSLASLIFSIIIYIFFDQEASGFQMQEFHSLIKSINCNYHLGIDGISIFFVILTTILTPICILASWNSIQTRVKEFIVAFLLLETLVIAVFCILDFLLFYITFEAMLIPMFIIIGIWGGEKRVYAAIKFFLYTLTGSLLLLVALVYIYQETHSFNIINLYKIVPQFTLDIQKLLWLAFFASFAIKVPMWPLHTWLPDAHVEAPTAGSVILAGVLLKMGAYGFLRFSLPMLPDASKYFADLVFILSATAVIYASFVAFAQTNMKKLIAYSSIAHMGFVTIGIFTFNNIAIKGAIFQMISHGIVSAALFLCVGALYDRAHTKEIDQYGGVVNKMPLFALAFMIFSMASIGLPSTSGFVGEALVILGTFQVNKLFAALIATSLVLGAAYMLLLYKRVMFGEVTNKNIANLKDLTLTEWIVFAPLIILTFLLGIYPKIVTDLLVHIKM